MIPQKQIQVFSSLRIFLDAVFLTKLILLQLRKGCSGGSLAGDVCVWEELCDCQRLLWDSNNTNNFFLSGVSTFSLLVEKCYIYNNT